MYIEKINKIKINKYINIRNRFKTVLKFNMTKFTLFYIIRRFKVLFTKLCFHSDDKDELFRNLNIDTTRENLNLHRNPWKCNLIPCNTTLSHLCNFILLGPISTYKFYKLSSIQNTVQNELREFAKSSMHFPFRDYFIRF